MKLVLSKLDVAERQLNEAIRLFFDEHDPISIHTLAVAAERVISDLGKKQKIISPLRDAELYIKPEGHKLWFDAIHRSANFFKHANSDESVKHEFNPEESIFIILNALFVFEKITNNLSWEMLVFTSWFILKYPKFIKNENDTIKRLKASAVINNILPDNKKQFSDTLKHIKKIKGHFRKGQAS